CTRALEYRQKGWCKFTATFSSHAVRGVIRGRSSATPGQTTFATTPGSRELAPPLGAMRKRRHRTIYRLVQTVTRSCGPGSFGSARCRLGRNHSDLKFVLIAELATV